jgi:hypothetical protein
MVNSCTDDKELQAIKKTVKEYKENPEILNQALIKAGIITIDGKLTEKYKPRYTNLHKIQRNEYCICN